MSSPKVVALTCADSAYFPLLQEMLESFERTVARPIPFACFDLGLNGQDVRWLRDRDVRILTPRWHFRVPEAFRKPANLGYNVRPFLREYLPGYDAYLWVDADVWLQDGRAIDDFIAGAERSGMAIAHERERAYRFQAWLFLWTAKHFLLGYGPLWGPWLLGRPHLNAGVFCLRRDAPHWESWAARYQRAIDRTGKPTPHDQFALNEAIYRERLPTTFLPPDHNWICDRGVPMWNSEAEAFCEPYPPFRTISVMHLAGPAKRQTYRVRTTAGSDLEIGLRYSMRPQRTSDPASLP